MLEIARARVSLPSGEDPCRSEQDAGGLSAPRVEPIYRSSPCSSCRCDCGASGSHGRCSLLRSPLPPQDLRLLAQAQVLALVLVPPLRLSLPLP